LRDDTASLVAEITGLFSRKIPLLEELLRREQDLSRSISRGPEEIQNILDLCAAIIEKISDIDCDIVNASDRLCHIAGITSSGLEQKLRTDNPSAFNEWSKMRARITGLARSINELREDNIRSMEKANLRSAKDADELSRMQRFLGRYGL